MVDGIHRFLQRRTQEGNDRGNLWQRDTSSPERYNQSVAENRQRFRQIIGAVDTRTAAQSPQSLGELAANSAVGAFRYRVHAVRREVCDPPVADAPGLTAEGLLLQPEGKPVAPRPFMVERGHDDPVGLDEWVAFEYAKMRRFYDHLGISDRTKIKSFVGPHSIHGVGTFEFLRQQLNLERDHGP